MFYSVGNSFGIIAKQTQPTTTISTCTTISTLLSEKQAAQCWNFSYKHRTSLTFVQCKIREDHLGNLWQTLRKAIPALIIVIKYKSKFVRPQLGMYETDVEHFKQLMLRLCVQTRLLHHNQWRTSRGVWERPSPPAWKIQGKLCF